MKTVLIAAMGAVVGSFLIRILQLATTVAREPAWWIFEVGRWGLVLGAFAALALAVYKLQARVMEHERRLAEIASEAMWARLELDIVDLGAYTPKA